MAGSLHWCTVCVTANGGLTALVPFVCHRVQVPVGNAGMQLRNPRHHDGNLPRSSSL